MNHEKFKDFFGEWAEDFKEFIESPEMDKIYEKLKNDSKKGRKICPDSENTFRVFKETSKKDLKVVWYLQDPYPSMKNNIKVANGIAMDCSSTGVIQATLDAWYSGVEDCLYNGLNLTYDKTPDLTYLTKQGVMLINTDLTVEYKKAGSHQGLWAKFQEYFIEKILNVQYPGLIYVFSGKSSEAMKKHIIPFNTYHFITEHPATAAYKCTSWKHEDVFKKINKILEQNNGPEFTINWLKDNELDDVPF